MQPYKLFPVTFFYISIGSTSSNDVFHKENNVCVCMIVCAFVVYKTYGKFIFSSLFLLKHIYVKKSNWHELILCRKGHYFLHWMI